MMKKIFFACFVTVIVFCFVCVAGYPAETAVKARARDLGIPFDGTPGEFNAITDVKGVEVGHTTLISGEGKLEEGKGPVRTGVTVIIPRGKKNYDPVFAGWFSLNGNGEFTGTTWVEESGFLEGPIGITNTNSAGIVRDAIIEWEVKNNFYDTDEGPALAAAGETWDGYLNDINGFHVKKEHVFAALDNAQSGFVAEGCVGGGTGMICHKFKGGIGTSSRVLEKKYGGYTVGVLVQANHGNRETLMIAGVPVGKEIPDLMPILNEENPPKKDSSIIVIVATDAPLTSNQLKRLARRVSMGIARDGGMALNSSGEIFLAFSTANDGASDSKGPINIQMLSNEQMDPLFVATVEATEEAIVNVLIAADTMVGINGNTAYAIPHDRLKEILQKYNRLTGQVSNNEKVNNLINVPFCRQATDRTCGVACLQSLIYYYYSNDPNLRWVREDDLAKEMKTGDEGTRYEEIVASAKAKGLNADVRMNMTLDELKQAIDQKKPVICVIQAWVEDPKDYEGYEDGHYVIAIGYDKENIYFMDPSTLGHYAYIPIKDFLVRWHDEDADTKTKLINFGIIISNNEKPTYNSADVTLLE